MLTVIGSVAVTVMMLSYWLEARSRWFVLSFAAGSAATAAYSAVVGRVAFYAVMARFLVFAVQRYLQRRAVEVRLT
jgi:hypothetical protein